jgi:hypothetical protein
MTHPPRALCLLAAVVALAAARDPAHAGQRDEDRKPSLSLRLSPPVGFTPLRVRVVVELRGGADDYADFYCPNIEWDWGDGTTSESGEDCEPYEAGKSSIKRRFSADYTYRQSGGYRVLFRLKQRNKVIAVSSGNVQVRPGVADDFDR